MKRAGSGSGSVSLRYCTDPRIRIRTKMSRIRNTDILKIMDFFLQENNEDITYRHGKSSRVQYMVRETVSLER
jgi:hypothetical protein